MAESTIRAGDPVVALINVFTCTPENQQRLVEAWQRGTDDLMRYLPGFISTNIHRSLDGTKEAMALRLLGAGPGAERRVRVLQHFVGEGAWDDDALLDEHQRRVDETLCEADGVLIAADSSAQRQGHVRPRPLPRHQPLMAEGRVRELAHIWIVATPHTFKPVRAMPRIKKRCASRNTIATGSTKTTLAAMR